MCTSLIYSLSKQSTLKPTVGGMFPFSGVLKKMTHNKSNPPIWYGITTPFFGLTSQITGGKKQSDEGATLLAVRVHLSCYAITCC